jgi:hypothetical protein
MAGTSCDPSALAGCGVAFSAGVAASARAAAVAVDRSTGAWDVRATAPGSSTMLHVARSVAKPGLVTAREVDGKTPTFGAPLAIDGTPVFLAP